MTPTPQQMQQMAQRLREACALPFERSVGHRWREYACGTCELCQAAAMLEAMAKERNAMLLRAERANGEAVAWRLHLQNDDGKWFEVYGTRAEAIKRISCAQANTVLEPLYDTPTSASERQEADASADMCLELKAAQDTITHALEHLATGHTKAAKSALNYYYDRAIAGGSDRG